MFERKDEVIIKHECLKHYKNTITNLTKKDGRKKVSKVGRVISLDDEFLQVDFWDSAPSKFSVKVSHVELVNKATEAERAATGLGGIVTKTQSKALLYNEAASVFSENHVAKEMPKITREQFEASTCILDNKVEEEEEDLKFVGIEVDVGNGVLTKELLDDSIKREIDHSGFGDVNLSKTGSMRYNTGKIDPTHLAPDFMMAMAEVLTKNEHKYTKYNYAKGQAYSTSTASLFRHLIDFMNGVDVDPTDECDMLAKIAVNAMITWCTKKYHLKDNPELDDRFKKILGI
jgi:hypothetical protein